jgi:hypothetical protein
MRFEPGMQGRIGRRQHALRAHLSGRWTKQGQQFGGPTALVLMGLSCGVAMGMPTGTGVGNGLIGASFILAPHR